MNGLLEGIRAAIYICFGILSVRMVLISVEHAPIANPFLIILLAAVVWLVACVKTSWSLYVFILGIPFLIGFQALDFLGRLPLLSPIFAIIYLAWLFRRIVVERRRIEPRSQISNWIDLLSGLVLFSLFFRLWPFGKDIFLYHFWHFQALSQDDILYSVDASFIFCQGLFFFRMLEMQNGHLFSEKRKMLTVICYQATIIFLFSLVQLVFKTPSPYAGFAIFSPLDDIHSFGSYAVMIFAVLLGAREALRPSRNRFHGNILLVISAGLIILSYSRITWIAAILILIWFTTRKLSLNKKLAIGLVIVIALGAISYFSHYFAKAENKYWVRVQSVIILKRLLISERLPEYSRTELWRRAFNIISDYPINGSGIGSFYLLSTHYQGSTEKVYKNIKENVHNYFLQVATELGIPASLIYLGVLVLVFKIAFTQFAAQKAALPFNRGFLMGIGAYLITCLTGHPLLLSTQQFLFWFMISAVVLSDGNLKPTNPRRDGSKYAFGAIILFVGLILVGYAFKGGKTGEDFEKYEIGLYPYEESHGKRLRWTSKIGIIKGDHHGRFLELDVYALPPDTGPKGLNFKMLLNGEVWEEVNISQSGTRKIRCYIPYGKSQRLEIKTVTNKTFKPVRYRINQDTRELGVMISEIKFGDEIPREGIGFHQWEFWHGDGIGGQKAPLPLQFRWTGMNASAILDEAAKDGLKIMLMATHPNIAKERVRVRVWGDRKIIKEELLSDHQWKEISLRSDQIKGNTILTFHVNRTWNPKLWGLSEDRRDLGVAVAIR